MGVLLCENDREKFQSFLSRQNENARGVPIRKINARLNNAVNYRKIFGRGF
jgi:hypothetical protein